MKMYLYVKVDPKAALARGECHAGKICLEVTPTLASDLAPVADRLERWVGAELYPRKYNNDPPRGWLPSGGLSAEAIIAAVARVEAEKLAKEAKEAESKAKEAELVRTASVDDLISSAYGDWRPKSHYADAAKEHGRWEEIQAECARRNAERAAKEAADKE